MKIEFQIFDKGVSCKRWNSDDGVCDNKRSKHYGKIVYRAFGCGKWRHMA